MHLVTEETLFTLYLAVLAIEIDFVLVDAFLINNNILAILTDKQDRTYRRHSAAYRSFTDHLNFDMVCSFFPDHSKFDDPSLSKVHNQASRAYKELPHTRSSLCRPLVVRR